MQYKYKLIRISLALIAASMFVLLSMAAPLEAGTARNDWDQGESIDLAEEEIKQQKNKHIIVQLKEDQAESMFYSNFALNNKIHNLKRIAQSVYSMETIETEEKDVDVLLEELRADERVLFAEKNVKRKLLHDDFNKLKDNYAHETLFFPNDPYYNLQWGLNSLRVPGAWSALPADLTPVTVAVIDTGIKTNPYHEDLQSRIAPGGFNFIFNDSYVYDYNGHGTSVSGIIAAATNNNMGIAGVAGPVDVQILPLQAGFTDGTFYLDDIIEAIYYAISKDVDVINLSLGGEYYSAIEADAIQSAVEKGITVVASAGNDGNDSYTYPASYENVISVGSISKEEQRSFFSNYNDRVDLVAPGEDILTTGLGYFTKYEYITGTSAAAPLVSGIVSLLKAVEPALSPSEIFDLMQNNALDLGRPGRDNEYGYGIVNSLQAVKALLPPETVSLTMEIAGQGTTVPARGVHSYDKGAIVTLKAIPADGWEFIKWEIAGSEFKDMIVTVTMDENKVAKACFTPAEAENNWIIIPSAPEKVTLDQAWLINFNRAFLAGEIDGIVIERDNNFISVKIQLFPEEARAIITPLEAYLPATTYNLRIFLNNLKRYKMYFTTEG